MTFLSLIVGLIFLTLCAWNTHAGVIEETCSLVYKKLGSGPYESLTISNESFTGNGKRYYGCVLRFSGNAIKITDAQRPDGLLGNPLPYCPNGELPVDLPHNLRNEDGWCAAEMADGPDGTSYKAFKKTVFCAVEGRWDGGDDSDPRQVPSPRYEMIVRCANR